MGSDATQLTLDLPLRPALGREDFSVSGSNARALAMVEGWRDWPRGKLALVGPEGAGKTHLAHVWAEMAGATVLHAADLRQTPLPEARNAAYVVEDIPNIAGNSEAEEALFHLHNAMTAQGNSVLFTGCQPPSHWGLRLPDLASRMQALPVALIEPPDDALLAHVLDKLLQDRQIPAPSAMIDYLVLHMERSFAEAGQVVAEIDRRALAERRPVGRKLASEVLRDRLG